MDKIPTRKLRNWELDKYWLRIAKVAASESWESVWGLGGWRVVMISGFVAALAALAQFIFLGWNATLDNLKIVGSSVLAGLCVFVVLVILKVIRKPCELHIHDNEQISVLEAENARLGEPQSDAPNLRTDFDSAPLGPIYLTPEGVWSESHSESAVKYIGLRMVIRNTPVEGKKVGPAQEVSVQVEFTHDTGLHAASGAPTAWLHEKLGTVSIKLGHEKQAIIAVRSGQEWFAITNVRDSSGYPGNRTAMRFQEAPWFKGTLRIGVIVNGEATQGNYTWEMKDIGSTPAIRKIAPL